MLRRSPAYHTSRRHLSPPSTTVYRDRSFLLPTSHIRSFSFLSSTSASTTATFHHQTTLTTASIATDVAMAIMNSVTSHIVRRGVDMHLAHQSSGGHHKHHGDKSLLTPLAIATLAFTSIIFFFTMMMVSPPLTPLSPAQLTSPGFIHLRPSHPHPRHGRDPHRPHDRVHNHRREGG